MAKPPSDAPVLFDVECDSSTIKQRKDGSYKLVMEGVERVHWETDDAEADDGYYNAKKYAKSYDNYYGEDAEVSAYETFTLADGSKEKCKFTITDVKYNQKSNKLVYDITPKNNKQADKITGIESETQAECAVYSTERTRWSPQWMPRAPGLGLRGADLSFADMHQGDLRHADLTNADLRYADLTNADLRYAALTNADLRYADLTNADLLHTHLEDADLSFADLSRAVLAKTVLRGANLSFADLSDAALIDADLSGTDMYQADLSEADLRFTTNLNQAFNTDMAFWFETNCPDDSMNVGTQPCSGDQLIPAVWWPT